MKKIYAVLLLLITGMANNFAQNTTDMKTEINTGISIVQDAANKLNVTYSSSERSDLAVRIKREDGKIVYSEKLLDEKLQHNRTYDLNRYGKGVYYVEVNTEKAQETKRVELN